MKRVLVSSIVCSSLIVVALASAQALAQGRHSRGIRVEGEVGATPEEKSAGRKVELWGVVIGISRYKNGDRNVGGGQIPNLEYAASDAEAIYNFLRSPEGGGFVPESEGGHLALLTDERATKANVESALAGLKKSRPEDYFILYMAAHGSNVPLTNPQTKNTEQVPFFFLHDTDVRDVRGTGLRMQAFQDAIKEVPAKRGLVLSDSCHSAGVQMAGRGVHTEDTKQANSSLIKTLGGLEGVGFISAADQTELSYESPELNSGVFTHFLLQGLGGNADADQNAVVTFKEIKEYLREEVPKYTRERSEAAQHPFFNTTTLEANNIALALVRYPEVENAGASSDAMGVLVIRTPDIDGVNLAIDGENFETLDTKNERRIRVPTGTRSLTFTKGAMKHTVQAIVPQGRSKLVEVNLTFSKDEDDDLIGPNELQLNVCLSEDKEPAKDAQELLQKGVDSFKRQKFEEAVDLFTRAFQASGNSYADALVYLGRAQQSLGRDEAAIKSFRAALLLRPSDYQAGTLLAEAKFDAGHNVEEVAQELKAIIARHPNDDFARVVYADVLLKRRDFFSAEKQARRAIAIKRRSPAAHLILSEALAYQDSKAKQGQAVDEAEMAIQLLGELSQKQVSVARGLKRLSISHLVFGGGRYVDNAAMAEAHYLAAKAINNLVNREDAPPDGEALLEKARLHIEESIKLSQRLRDKRRLMLAFDTGAKMNFLRGDDAAAIRDAEQALSIARSIPQANDFADPFFMLSLAYENQQKYAKAYESLQKYIAMAGKTMTPDDLQEKSEHLERLKRLKEANRQK